MPKRLFHIAIMFITGLTLLPGAPAQGAEPLTGKYGWGSKAEAQLFQKALWEPIRAARLSAFTVPVVEKAINCTQYDNDHPPENSLRRGGGMCGEYYWLEQGSGTSLVKIDTEEKLKQTLGPIDNEAKAVAILTLLKNDLVEGPPNKVPEGHILKTEQGYLVQLKDSYSFGCGHHIPRWVIYSVSRSGDIKLAAVEKIKEPKGPGICVD